MKSTKNVHFLAQQGLEFELGAKKSAKDVGARAGALAYETTAENRNICSVASQKLSEASMPCSMVIWPKYSIVVTTGQSLLLLLLLLVRRKPLKVVYRVVVKLIK
uniref:Uncharacterized protein n=1 Tax=Anopheles farauti TaxID=69004 RepID=A0A182QI92_9DIPT